MATHLKRRNEGVIDTGIVFDEGDPDLSRDALQRSPNDDSFITRNLLREYLGRLSAAK